MASKKDIVQCKTHSKTHRPVYQQIELLLSQIKYRKNKNRAGEPPPVPEKEPQTPLSSAKIQYRDDQKDERQRDLHDADDRLV